MKCKLIYILFGIIISFGLKAQSVTKTTKTVYEYLSAEYNSEKGIIIISAKDSKGEFYTFHFSEKDKIKNADLLYNPIINRNAYSKKSFTKSELIGKKIQIGTIPDGEIDPANPYCCYIVVEVSL